MEMAQSILILHGLMHRLNVSHHSPTLLQTFNRTLFNLIAITLLLFCFLFFYSTVYDFNLQWLISVGTNSQLSSFIFINNSHQKLWIFFYYLAFEKTCFRYFCFLTLRTFRYVCKTVGSL